MDKFAVESFVGLIADSCAHCLIDDENYVAPDTTPQVGYQLNSRLERDVNTFTDSSVRHLVMHR
jgi:hypothetical protein